MFVSEQIQTMQELHCSESDRETTERWGDIITYMETGIKVFAFAGMFVAIERDKGDAA